MDRKICALINYYVYAIVQKLRWIINPRVYPIASSQFLSTVESTEVGTYCNLPLRFKGGI